MAKVISISNHKGGVGKTTSTVNIGAGLNTLNKKVLLIDLDPQASLSQCFGLAETERTIYGAIKNDYPLSPINVVKNLDVVASTLDLSGAEMEFGSEPGREYLLKELIDPIKDKYDYIIIDCPPSLGLLTWWRGKQRFGQISRTREFFCFQPFAGNCGHTNLD